MKENKDYKSALNVIDGVEQPSQVNPYLNFTSIAKPQQFDVKEYVEKILAGDRVFLSRAITLIESNLQSDNEKAQAILEACIPHAGNSIRIGITGVPGAGKSTFIEAFGNYVTSLGHTLAVLAIDPSSERSKGSILGDKTRMETLSTKNHAFIRPSPSAGTLGGVARKTAETLILCEAAGYDVVLIETVGVGQSETTVKNMVDFFLLLAISGAGDELQGVKRGIMEMTDAVVVNKADGDNVQHAQLTKKQLENALMLFPKNISEWTPKVLTVSSLENIGIDHVWNMIQDYFKLTKENGFFEQNRKLQLQERFYSFMKEELLDKFYADKQVQSAIDNYKIEMLKGQISPYAAGRKVLEKYLKNNE